MKENKTLFQTISSIKHTFHEQNATITNLYNGNKGLQKKHFNEFNQ